MNKDNENSTEVNSHVVETIRAEIENMDFTPLDDEAFADLQQRHADAVNDSYIEGHERTPTELAIDDMLLDMKAPDKIHDYAVQRYLEMTVMKGKSLEGLFDGD